MADTAQHTPNLRPYCNACGWRKGGPDSWDGMACKCGHTEPPIRRVDPADTGTVLPIAKTEARYA